jgi:hypothetical protein
MNTLAFSFSLIGIVMAIAAGLVQGQWQMAVLAAPVMAGSMWLYWYLHFRFLMWLQRRDLRLIIGPAGICREGKGARHVVPWERITRVKIRSATSFTNDTVEVHTADGLALDLHEFERVSDIAQAVESHLGKELPVERESRTCR